MSTDPESHMSQPILPKDAESYLLKLVESSRRLAEFYHISATTTTNGDSSLYFVASTDTDRFIAKKSNEWRHSPLGFVIFWGNRKDDRDENITQTLWATDLNLVKTFEHFQQVLIYYSMKVDTMNDWINLVVIENTYGPDGWNEHPLHAQAVKMSHKFFDSVYLYRGTLIRGLNVTDGMLKYALVKKTFIDYRIPNNVKRVYCTFDDNANFCDEK